MCRSTQYEYDAKSAEVIRVSEPRETPGRGDLQDSSASRLRVCPLVRALVGSQLLASSMRPKMIPRFSSVALARRSLGSGPR